MRLPFVRYARALMARHMANCYGRCKRCLAFQFDIQGVLFRLECHNCPVVLRHLAMHSHLPAN
jgi:hypothetical protein